MTVVYNAILVVEELPEIGSEESLYKIANTQKLYYWDANEGKYICLNCEFTDTDTNTDNIIIVEELPAIGEENLLYKLPDQSFYFWNKLSNSFSPLVPNAEIIIPPVEVKGGIEVVNTIEDLPLIGNSDMLYKVLSNELVYTWNISTNSYKSLNAEEIIPIPPIDAKSNIKVVDSFGVLPEVGENDVLYKTNDTQLLYLWNNNTNIYQLLGQGSSITPTEGYNITLQNASDSRIFIALEGDPVSIAFRYASVDQDGMNDGPGIGTLIVNQVKKATIAVQQKLNTLDITKYLSLGENSVELIVENSENKTKSLTYQIEIINLSLSTNFKDMGIYSGETEFAFVITGSGAKTIHYVMDGEEIDNEVLTNTQKLAHTYKIPEQPAGDHIFEVYADMEIDNMSVSSNTLTLGMMYVNDHMVNTYILTNFTQDKAIQGEVITIPYLVYNPFNETSTVTLRIYNEDESLYSEKELLVDQTVQSWVVQDYPVGNIKLELFSPSETGQNAVKTLPIAITASSFDLTPVSSSLLLEFSAQGRSNNEANPASWSYGDINATFERFAWSTADGWLPSDSGETILRFLPKNKMEIPFQPFATDKRTTGYTIEIEMATHNVKDYDSVVLSCMDEGRGFIVKSQSVIFKSEQSEEIVTMFKEDERVRVTLTIEPQTLNRFIKLYINGILSGVEQYKENDNFQQANPQNITVGSDSCGLDLYKLRFYNRNLSDSEQLTNFICDRSSLNERIEAKNRNDIYDISGNLTIASLPATIPYIVLQCEELPQYKGDKKKNKSMYFVDKLRPDRCFSASDCQFDVQGTSSAGYPIKNFKVKFGSGIVYNNGTTADGYPILEDGLISKCLCLKADYASSEQANNVMLVDYYDELIRDYYLTPAQEEDERVRTAISGRPIVVFWENTETGEIKFQGQYNMNNDKSNENVFGFDRDKYPKLECWEFSNNTSDRTLFKRSEWLEEIYDKEKDKMVPAWMSDFEARFPDLDDPYSDYTQFKRFCDFIVSTDRRQTTNEMLPDPVTYGSEVYLRDDADYRLAKFKNEFEQYGILDTFIFYYIFTETFLMIDSRAKNLFLTTFDGTHWFPIPYDFDTAIGINNEGDLVFDYDLEDTDIVNEELVFNGQESTLWINIRDAFQARRFEMYDELRQSDKFAYDVISKKMHDHQSIWPEAIWNENSKVKYLDIFLTEGEKYFEMCQGPKGPQRDWWLFNGFKYRDSKYQCGDSEEYSAFFRAYAPGDMTVTPYQHLWPRVDYTDTYPVTQRSKRNVENTLECPLDTASDTEIWLRSADRMASFGDLSQYKADTVKFASAVKLQELILGSSAEGYENHKLTSVELGNNRLIGYLNVENCVNLVNPIDLSNCYNLETVKARGSSLNSINFPAGGHLTTLELPGTFTNLTLRNQHGIKNFSMESYDLINTLWIDDTPGLPIEELLLNTPKLDRVRLTNLSWDVTDEATLVSIFEKLKTCGGLDANGNNTIDGKAVVTGSINIPAISDTLLEEINEYFKELIIYVNGVARFFIRYLNQDNTLLYKYATPLGADAIDPIAEGLIDTPTMEGSEEIDYEFNRWSSLPTNVQGPQNIIAMYNIEYRVQFYDGNNKLLYEEMVLQGTAAADPFMTGLIKDMPTKESDAQYEYIYKEWDSDFSNVTAPMKVYATFTSTLRSYPVYFYNGDQKIQETEEFYGTCATFLGDESEVKKMIGGEPSNYYEFAYWRRSPSTITNPDGSTTELTYSDPIIGTTYFYAEYLFDGYIEDDWSTIVANASSDMYGYGGKKKTQISYSYRGKEYSEEVEFEIIGRNQDALENGDTAPLTFRGILSVNAYMNTGTKDWLGNQTLDGGGWALSDLREWLNGRDFYERLPEDLKAGIKKAIKQSDNGYYDYHGKTPALTQTADNIFVASPEELSFTDFSRYTMLGQGTPYPMFTDANSRKVPGKLYWTRSSAGAYTLHSFCVVDLDGRLTTNGGGNSLGVVVCFCI